MSTEPTIRRAWQWFLVLASLSVALPAVSRAAEPEKESGAKSNADDLKIIQGMWEREEPSGTQASYKRATKEIRGNKETVSYYDAENRLVRRHNVDFTVSRMGDVKIFTYTQMEITEGPQKGTKNPGPVSYVYWANDKFFREVWGFLPGQEAPPVVLYIWKRADDERREAGLAAARETPQKDAAPLEGTWRATKSERGGEAEPEDQSKRHRIVFTKDAYRIERDGELMMRGKYTVDSSKQPATIDMTIEEMADRPEHVGKMIRGIVEHTGDELKWAFGRPDGSDRPTKFSSEAGQEGMFIVFKREKE